MGGGKDTKPKIVPCCRSGSDAQQGRRMTMEDTHVHFDDVSEKYSFPKDITRAFYAVYDGHGGRRAAEAAEVSHTNSFALFFFGCRCCSRMWGLQQRFLHECLLKSEELKKSLTDDEVLEVMKGAFKRTDSIIMEQSRIQGWNDGCTAVAALILNTTSVFILFLSGFPFSSMFFPTDCTLATWAMRKQ